MSGADAGRTRTSEPDEDGLCLHGMPPEFCGVCHELDAALDAEEDADDASSPSSDRGSAAVPLLLAVCVLLGLAGLWVTG